MVVFGLGHVRGMLWCGCGIVAGDCDGGGWGARLPRPSGLWGVYCCANDCVMVGSWLCSGIFVVMLQVMVVVGGQAPKAIRSVECFDFEEQRWYQVAELPSRRCRAGRSHLTPNLSLRKP